MKGNSIKLKKFFLHLVTAVSVIVIVTVGGGTLLVRFYIEPRLGMTGSDVVTISKHLADLQTIENLKNFDKQSAKDVLSAMLEIEEESGGEETGEQTPEEVWNNNIQSAIPGISAAAAKTVPKSAKEFASENGVKVTQSQENAYDRIMAAAKTDEISAGMSILSKVDLGKVRRLQKEGSDEALKNYLKQVLTNAEISQALALYNKYKHLL